MSYRPGSQQLQPSIDQICDGIESFMKAVNERARDEGEWSNEHLHEITELSCDMQRLSLRLRALRRETW